MSCCENCTFADWDYETFYGTTKRQYFVTGCKKNLDVSAVTDCEEFHEDD